jgi:hypothetical protein
VWHYRRATIRAYLRQQAGYGEAEAMLVRKHPENFNFFGGSIWRGRIYGSSKFGVELRPPVIYHGLFGSAGFQKIYSSEPATTLMFCTTLEYHLFFTLPLWILSAVTHHFLPVAIASLLIPMVICIAAGAQANLPAHKTKWWSRPLIALLFFLQPIVRGWARYRGRLTMRPEKPVMESLDSVALRNSRQPLGEIQYWAQKRIDRLAFVAAILQRLDKKNWPNKSDAGWSDHDVEIYGSRWAHLQLTTVTEDHPNDRQLVRCRLRPEWSLQAKVIFALLFAFDFLAIGLTGFNKPWPWLVLLTLPLFAWFVLREQRKLQSVMNVFLDELSKESGMTKIKNMSESDAGN